MARQKWTLALIIIFIPILATVITAFRVRDLPKSFQDDFNAELKKHKCDNCDVNKVKVGHKLHIDKTESAKIKYEELKKAVKEKQQLISQKELHKKSSFKIVEDSEYDDDDNDESLQFSISGSSLKERKLKVPRVDRPQGLRKDSTVKAHQVDDDDDVNDNDDDGRDNENGKELPLKKQNVLRKGSPLAKLNKGQKTNKLFGQINDENDDDDEKDKGGDDEDDSKDKKVIKKTSSKSNVIQKSHSESKEKTKLDTKLIKNSYISKENSFNDEDKSREDFKSETIKKDLQNNKKTKAVRQKLISISLDDDEDDDDDDDDENNDNESDILSRSTLTDDTVSKVMKSAEKTLSIKHDDDDDDDNDEIDEDGIFSSLFKKAQNLILLDISEEQSQNILKSEIKTTGKNEGKHQTQSMKQQSKIDIREKKTNEKFVPKKPSEPTKTKPNVHEKKSNDPVKPKSDSNKDDQKDKKESKPKHVIENKIKQIDKGTVRNKPEEEKELRSKVHEEPKKEKKTTETKREVKHKTDAKREVEDSTESLTETKEILERHDKYLKTVNAALQRRNLLQSEFEDFYAFFPTFAPNFSRIHNPECRRHGQILLRQLRGTKLWALNMLDATAKIPSGILQGNGIQLGDFDQCLGSRARVQLDSGSVVKVQGQYCLARVDLRAEHPDLELPVHLAQAKNLIKSRIDDPGHFVPRFSTLSWGVCLPSACDPEDVEVVVKDALKHYQHTTGLAIRIKVDEEDCHTHDGDWLDNWSELPTIVTLSLYGVIILLVFIATIQDFLNRRKSDEGQTEEVDENAECDQKENKDEEENSADDKKQADGFFSQFSLYRTIRKLVEPCASDEISCIHGVRALATIALLVVHKFLPVAALPFTNRLKITETVSSPLWSWCRAGWMYTDCFLLLSGTLTAHKMASDTSAPRRLFSRYLRLSPALLAVVLFYAYIWDNLSTGPMWGSLVTKNAEVCQEGWWWNMLYVQNYFGFEEMCAPQTHQLALDLQLTILGGIIVWAVQVKERLSWLLMPALHAIAAYSRYSTVQEHRLTLIVYHGVTVSQLYRTARLSYTSVLHRSTPYLVGLSLGMILQKPSEHGKIFTALGWVVSASLWGLVWYAGLESGSTTFRYSAADAAQYAALAPLASALAVAWVIYAVHNGSFEFLSRLLSCRPLVLISRLSYAFYLCQFVVFLTQAATVRSSAEFSLMSLIDVQEISAILLSSVILTLTFVIPMQSLHKLFTISSKHDSEEEENAEKGESDEMSEEKRKDDELKIEEIEVPQIKNRHHFLAHREVLEEIPEVEVEFEMQRDRLEGLEEILEEEEEEEAGDDEPSEDELENQVNDEDLEIIEEEQGEDDFWGEREENTPRTMYSRQEQRDSDEWEWTSDGNERSGAQYYRYSR